MKMFILTLFLLTTIPAFACQCSHQLMDSDRVVYQLLKRLYPDHNLFEDEWGPQYETLRLYPSLLDKLFFKMDPDMANSSCSYEGPNGEKMFACSPRFKGDFRFVLIRKDGTSCHADVRATPTVKKAKAKFLRSNC